MSISLTIINRVRKISCKVFRILPITVNIIMIAVRINGLKKMLLIKEFPT